ncbi:MAG: response regulator [Pseudomonadota bacterium]
MLERILYVDDDEALTELAELVLDMEGITLKACHSGVAALEVAEAFAPQLILLDREMPDMDGPATLAALRQLTSLAAVPAIFMTAETDPVRVAELESLGAIAVLPKPIDPATLADDLRAAFANA